MMREGDAKGHENERKSFESKMKAEYKLKKERWKKEMESQETPKSQRNQGKPIRLKVTFNSTKLFVSTRIDSLLYHLDHVLFNFHFHHLC